MRYGAVTTIIDVAPTKRKRVIMPKHLLFLAVIFLLVACEDSVKRGPRLWISYGGLEWSKQREGWLNWYEAKEYCASIGGRLPTVDEIKTLFPYCKKIQKNGSCQLSDPECLTFDCWEPGCSCDERKGDRVPSMLGDDSVDLWLSSVFMSDDRQAFVFRVWWDFGEFGMEYKERQRAELRCVKLTPEEINDTEKPDDITEYGLFWSERGPFMTWQEADDYCEALEEDGHDDWRLPTINELRTIIINCPDTMPGGSCNVSDPECLDETCSKDCSCEYENTPHDNFSYSSLGDSEIVRLWSSSITPPYTPQPSYHLVWKVAFSDDSIYSSLPDNGGDVRCVRTPSRSEQIRELME